MNAAVFRLFLGVGAGVAMVFGSAGCGGSGGGAPAKDGGNVVTPPEVPMVDEAAVIEIGAGVAGEALGLLSGQLQGAMAEGGPVNAVRFCSEKALALTASVKAGDGIAVRRLSHRARNPENRVTADERVVLDGFAAALEAGEETAPVVAAHGDGSATFYAPITVFAPLCLKCHGEPGSDIDEATVATLAELYPEDAATGFALGDLRGMWAIRVPAGAVADRPE